jgi:hypothetical protein
MEGALTACLGLGGLEAGSNLGRQGLLLSAACRLLRLQGGEGVGSGARGDGVSGRGESEAGRLGGRKSGGARGRRREEGAEREVQRGGRSPRPTCWEVSWTLVLAVSTPSPSWDEAWSLAPAAWEPRPSCSREAAGRCRASGGEVRRSAAAAADRAGRVIACLACARGDRAALNSHAAGSLASCPSRLPCPLRPSSWPSRRPVPPGRTVVPWRRLPASRCAPAGGRRGGRECRAARRRGEAKMV